MKKVLQVKKENALVPEVMGGGTHADLVSAIGNLPERGQAIAIESEKRKGI